MEQVKLVINGVGNGLSPVRHKAFIKATSYGRWK